MTLNLYWFLPTSGDSRHLGRSKYGRLTDGDYLNQVAVAADTLGYDGILIPTGAGCEDPWITAATVASVTRYLNLLVAFRPSLLLPAVAARMAASLDRASGGRLQVNIVPGGDAAELAADGVFLEHDSRFAQADEFLDIWKALLAGQTISHDRPVLTRSRTASWSCRPCSGRTPRSSSAGPRRPPTPWRPSMSTFTLPGANHSMRWPRRSPT